MQAPFNPKRKSSFLSSGSSSISFSIATACWMLLAIIPILLELAAMAISANEEARYFSLSALMTSV
jgi:hypothetical protein